LRKKSYLQKRNGGGGSSSTPIGNPRV